MEYKIEKVTTELNKNYRGQALNSYPILKLKVGEMFKAPKKKKMSIYNAIKHQRMYNKLLLEVVFTIRTVDKDTIAVIRKK